MVNKKKGEIKIFLNEIVDLDLDIKANVKYDFSSVYFYAELIKCFFKDENFFFMKQNI